MFDTNEVIDEGLPLKIDTRALVCGLVDGRDAESKTHSRRSKF